MENNNHLIDVQTTKAFIAANWPNDPLLKQIVFNLLDKLPTVDAVEVVHGRWLDVQETDMYVPDMKFTITKTAETCSNCKVRIGFIGAKQYLFDAVCPNCGADMR